MLPNRLPRRIEASLERLLELPFTRGAAVDLPLLKSRLRQAMVDELKLVPPSRYRLLVPADQAARVQANLPTWKRDLADYFLEVVQENGWSAVATPEIEVVVDPKLRGSSVLVAVDEADLLLHGRPIHRKERASVAANAVVSTVVVVVTLYLMALLAAPSLLPQPLATPRLPIGDPVQALGRAAGDLQRQVASRWDEVGRSFRDSVGNLVPGGARAEDEPSGEEMVGEVTASPGLVVRAGSPDTRGASRAESRLSTGSAVRWRSSQVVHGEMIDGEDRWIEIGRAGPEWGDRAGQRLYIWMGGLRVE